MRMLLIALGVLIVLGGGGAGAYFYFLNPAKATVGEAEQALEEAKAEETVKEKRPTFEFVELDPLILPIVDNNGVSQVVNVMIAIDVPDAESKTKVETMQPRLKNAFIQDLYGALSAHAARKGGNLEISTLQDRLTKVGGRLLGEDQVNGVLLQVVEQRPI